MNAKDWLIQPHELKEEILEELENLAVLRSIVEKVTTDLSFTAGCSSSKEAHGFENAMLNIKAEEDKIWEKTELLQKTILEVLYKIDELENPKHRAVLRMRYIQDMKFSEIAARLDLCEDRVWKIHRAALKEFENSCTCL